MSPHCRCCGDPILGGCLCETCAIGDRRLVMWRAFLDRAVLAFRLSPSPQTEYSLAQARNDLEWFRRNVVQRA